MTEQEFVIDWGGWNLAILLLSFWVFIASESMLVVIVLEKLSTDNATRDIFLWYDKKKEVLGAVVRKYKECVLNKFYKYDITKRLLIVITIGSMFSTIVFAASAFFIMRNQLFNKTKSENIKDVVMIEQEINLFMTSVRNDAVSVLVSDSCQKLMDSFDDMDTSNASVQYRKNKMMQSMIMSTVGQRDIYHTIVFYDTNGKSYADDRLEMSDDYKMEESRIKEFLDSGKNEDIVLLHKSAWKQKKEKEYTDCIGYVRKVYQKESGKLIGAIELEIANEQFAKLYQPVQNNGSRIWITVENQIISADDKEKLYKDLSGESWYAGLRSETKDEIAYKDTSKYIYFCKPYKEFGWNILCMASKASYMKDVQRYAWIDIILGIFLLISNIVFCRVLVVSITKPLSKITKTIVKMGKGDLDQRIHVKDGGEIGTLADEFNKMADQTQMLMAQVVDTEKEKRESELSLVQMQMTPHFFYNILESICGLIVIDEKKTAIKTINLLSKFYRGVLSKGQEVITIEKELELSQNYLEIMKICHPDKFAYDIQCSEEVLCCKIPKMTLQPILENAIHHGFGKISSGGQILITGKLEEHYVIVEVRDNGGGFHTEIELDGSQASEYHMESFGLANTNRRIVLYFGEDYGIRIMKSENGARVQIRLPKEEA